LLFCHFEISKTEIPHYVRVSEFTFEKVTEEGYVLEKLGSVSEL